MFVSLLPDFLFFMVGRVDEYDGDDDNCGGNAVQFFS
jgi:hypothetical protein